MPRRNNDCQARQYGDQMICHACGLNWDTNDPEPPACRKVDRRTTRAKAADQFDKDNQGAKKAKGLPAELPPDLAAEMVRTFNANKTDGAMGHVRGMQAAYRLLLDRVEL